MEQPNPNKPVEQSTAGPFSFNKHPHGVRHALFNPYLLSDYDTATPNKYSSRDAHEQEKK